MDSCEICPSTSDKKYTTDLEVTLTNVKQTLAKKQVKTKNVGNLMFDVKIEARKLVMSLVFQNPLKMLILYGSNHRPAAFSFGISLATPVMAASKESSFSELKLRKI